MCGHNVLAVEKTSKNCCLRLCNFDQQERMMSSRLTFKDELFRRLAEYPCERPYVCEGKPSDCRVFMVGCNPATTLDSSFRKYILDDSGKFDFSAFMNDYKAERSRQETKTGRQKSEISPTRQRLEEIRKAAAPTQILETNVYASSTPTQAELRDRNTDIFKFLV